VGWRQTGCKGPACGLTSIIIIIIIIIIVVVVIVIIIIISCQRFSFFPGTSPIEPVVNPTTQASSLSL
jgi:flagellar basal body-associated protein FliL